MISREWNGDYLDFNVIIDSLEYRVHTYHWLRQMYISEPPMEIIQELRMMAREYDEDDEITIETDLIRFLKNLKDEDLRELEVELKAEFARLFLGPNKLLAPPFESVYLSPRRRLMGEETIKVREKYREMEMKTLEKGNIPDDHIGLELEFMYYLCYKALDSFKGEVDTKYIRKNIEMQNKFISQHLIKWVPLFCKDIRENTNLLFFKEIANFTEKFIIEEKDTIAETVKVFKSIK